MDSTDRTVQFQVGKVREPRKAETGPRQSESRALVRTPTLVATDSARSTQQQEKAGAFPGPLRRNLKKKFSLCGSVKEV